MARQVRFPSAAQAARALGVPTPTYNGHENGSRGFVRSAARYAAFFRVSLDWLVDGRGPMRGGARTSLPVVGTVGAGASVYPLDVDVAGTGIIDELDLPDLEFLAALRVTGDSQYPRYIDGEYIVYDARGLSPGHLVNRYVVADLADGRRLLKLLRKMPTPGRYRLESHNAPPEDDADIVAVYPIRLVVPVGV